MDTLTADQARALWEAGGFVVLTGLPEGSEFGIDGTFHIVRKFSGIKFVPPDIRFISWSASDGNGNEGGPSSIPIRSAIIKFFKTRERLVLRYDSRTESLVDSHDGQEVIADAELWELDAQLAPYPFEGLDKWKSLINHVDQDLLEAVVGDHGIIDGLTPSEGEKLEENGIGEQQQQQQTGRREKEKTMKFPMFDLKRSWREGAVGEEVTRYSQDKSWLFGHVVEQVGGVPLKLVAHLQLSFVILLYLSSFSALNTYKRLLELFSRSSSVLLAPNQYFSSSSASRDLTEAYIALIDSLARQIQAIPQGTFEVELPDMDVFYLDTIERLRSIILAVMYRIEGDMWDEDDVREMRASWKRLREVGRGRWDWEIADLLPSVKAGTDSDEEEEEGEYAPVIVDM